MRPSLQMIANEFYTPTPIECPTDGVRKLDGTGPHLGLRNPWYNDLSHDITDSTIFRVLLIIMILEWVFKKL